MLNLIKTTDYLACKGANRIAKSRDKQSCQVNILVSCKWQLPLLGYARGGGRKYRHDKVGDICQLSTK